MDDFPGFDHTAPHAPLLDYHGALLPGPLVPTWTPALLDPQAQGLDPQAQGLDSWPSALARPEAMLDAPPALPVVPPRPNALSDVVDPLLLHPALAAPLLLANLPEAPQRRKRGRPRKIKGSSSGGGTSAGTSSGNDSSSSGGYPGPMPSRQKRNQLAAARSRTRASVEMAHLSALEQVSTLARQQLIQQRDELEEEVLALRVALQDHLVCDMTAGSGIFPDFGMPMVGNACYPPMGDGVSFQ